MKVYDGSFEYSMDWKSIQPRCDLKVFTLGRQPEVNTWVVVFAQPTDGYEGVSVTNAAEQIAGQAATRFEVPFQRALWVEHYPEKDRFNGKESFDLVTFDWAIVSDRRGGIRFRASLPVWHPVSREWIEALVEEEI